MLKFSHGRVGGWMLRRFRDRCLFMWGKICRGRECAVADRRVEGGKSAAPPQQRVSYGNSSRENSINQSLPAGKRPWATLGPLLPIMLSTLMASTLKWLQLPAEVDFGRYVECVWAHVSPEAGTFTACPFFICMWGFQGSATLWHPPQTTSLVIKGINRWRHHRIRTAAWLHL